MFAVPSPALALVFLHGGSGDRQQLWRHAARMAERGFVGAALEWFDRGHSHGHSPNRPPLLELVQSGMRWVRRHAEELRVDPLRLGAVGASAGAPFAAIAGGVEGTAEGVSSSVQASVCIAGAFLGPDTSRVTDVLPYWSATPATAPTLLIHAAEDPAVPYEDAVAYRRRLGGFGARCELATEPSSTHRSSDKARYYERCLPIMERFLADVLG